MQYLHPSSGRMGWLTLLILHFVCQLSDILLSIPLLYLTQKISPLQALIVLFRCRTRIRQPGSVHRHFYLLNYRVFLKNTLYNQRKNLLFIAPAAGAFFVTMCYMPGHKKRCRNAAIARFSGVGVKRLKMAGKRW